MTRSSKARRSRARAKNHALNGLAKLKTVNSDGSSADLPALTQTDKRYLIGFAVLSLIITAVYWSMGGRNLFVFPALMCISVGARKYWAGPIRRFADNS